MSTVNVLLAENDKHWRSILSDYLQSALDIRGVTPNIVDVSNFPDAWRLASGKRTWHLYVVDIGLKGKTNPEKHGIRLAERARDQGVPCIVVSGEPTLTWADIRRLFKEVGIADFLPKEDFGQKDFIKVVRRELKGILRSMMVFMSYASEDRRKVTALCKKLEKEGIRTWMDKTNLVSGRWKSKIKKAIGDCDAVVVCLSPDVHKEKGFIRKEIEIICELAADMPMDADYVIPVKIRDVDQIPEPLQEWHCLDCTEQGGFKRLMKALRARQRAIGLLID